MLSGKTLDRFLESLKNPRWVEPEGRGPILLDGEINGGKVQFFASSIDGADYGREVYEKAINGHYGEIAPYSDATVAEINPHLLEVKNPPPEKDLF